MTADGLRSPDAAAPDVVDVVALGESMVTFLPTRPGRLADVPSFDRAIGGAESNVVCVLAAAGHTARWVSRVGADGFGDHLVEEIGSYGVDVSSVRRDPVRPTGVYFRTAGDRATGAHEVAYYRAGSAASAMSTRTVDLTAVRAGRVLHLSGITAALSDDCLRLLRDLTAPRPSHHPLVSFDVNHRRSLWRDPDGPHVLLELARGADLVFVGEDEAEEAWGVTGGPGSIRALLPEPHTLVVKQGSHGATLFTRTPPPEERPRTDGRGRAGGCPPAAAGVHHRAQPHPTAPAGPRTETPRHAPDPTPSVSEPVGEPAGGPTPAHPRQPTDTTTFVPAPTVHVTAAVGAGDAFAAGFLSATLRSLPARDRLRHGHLMAAAALTAPGDLAIPPRRGHADRLAALDDDAWGRLRLAPGWTDVPDRAEEEVHTP
ncbi:PfkB family carbohydrate kinase [Streptomyces sp. 11x1]|uniref:PfkB family carbohydrate kinase n=1 Tax=Streptomyces sp. 11x1 TaxID=3038642 RepID=UPI00292EDE99|nr:PfkB family carbohydrate kinase [Streptomyces sp. 11x1]WNZ08971.1 PfkB family carbohydrate kinase [Streptomyces sp. 11x1]